VIHYLCTQEHSYTVGQLLAWWAPDLAGRFRLVPYDDVLAGTARPMPGVHIFADLERLPARTLQAAIAFRASLEPLGDRARVLNDPARVLRRYDLLRTLHASWINSFDAYRVSESRRPRSWPVLLRREDDHNGPVGELLETKAELDEAVAALVARGESAERLIAVEFRNTADAQGTYRKYGAFLIGDHVIPRHVLISREWCVKDPDLLEPEHIEEELRYVSSFPHANEIRRVFKLARIDYGRIDYAFYDGRLQVWEINTNPMLATMESAVPGAPRREANERFVGLAREAFLALDAPFVTGPA
jgi:hypothetical protein